MLTSPRAAPVAAARRLAKKSFRQAERAFLVEGRQSVAEALAEPGALTALFATDEAAGHHPDLLERARAGGVAVHLVSAGVMSALAQTVTPQGLVGVAPFRDVALATVAAARPRLVAVLAAVRDPGNAGSLLRAADAAGAGAAVFAETSVDPYNGKCVRASAGSLFHLPVVAGVAAEATVAALRAAGLQVLAATADGAVDLDAAAADGRLARPTAWLFGNEAWGLAAPLRGLADATVRVPIHGRAESLNLATAAAVCLYASAAAQRSAAAAAPPSQPSPSGAPATPYPPAAPRPPAEPAGPGPAVARLPGMPAPVAVPALDDIPDGVVVAGPDGAVEQVNRAAARLLGCEPAAVVGTPFTRLLPLTDAAGRDWWACTRPYDGLATRTGQPERALVLPDGRELLVTARYARDRPAGPVVRLVVCLRDPAARRRAERSRADLVSTVAHELRSPLTSVKGFTATLLAKWERFGDEQKKVMLQTVNADADRVTRLISELLDVSRIEAGRLEVHRSVVDLPAALARSVAGHVAAGVPPERFDVQLHGTLPEMWLDQDKIDQVLANLVENALRHGAGRVTLRAEPAGDGALLTVADEGPGLPAEAHERAFRKFWRGGRRGGTGLGLYIAKGLVEAHAGSIEAATAPAGGAVFRVRLPAGTPAFLLDAAAAADPAGR